MEWSQSWKKNASKLRLIIPQWKGLLTPLISVKTQLYKLYPTHMWSMVIKADSQSDCGGD